MASLSALSAAIRNRLLSDDPAPLPGFGTIRRVRVPAKVQTQADGSRTLQPPSESLRLVLGSEPDAGPLALALAREAGLPVAAGAKALLDQVEQLEAVLAIKGEVELEGVGVLRRTDRGLLFGADPGLLAMINEAYEGLSTVGTAAEEETPAVAPFSARELVEAEPIEAESAAQPTSNAEPEGPHTESTPPRDEASPPAEDTTEAELAEVEETDADVPSGDGVYGGEPLDAFIIAGGEGDGESALAASLREDVESAGLADGTPQPSEDDPTHDLSPAPSEPSDESEEALPTGLDEPSATGTETQDVEPATEDDFDFSFEPEASGLKEEKESELDSTDETIGDAAPALPFQAFDPLDEPAPLEVDATTELSDLDPEELEADTYAGAPAGAEPRAEDEDPTAAGATPDGVDELLADVWTSGAPAASALGATPRPDRPPATPPANPAAPQAPPSHTFAYDDEPGAPDEESTSEFDQRPDGLPMMPVGWSPSGDFDDEYDDEGRGRGVVPWLVAVAAVIALAFAAVLLWPRLSAGGDQGPEVASDETQASETDLLPGTDEAPVDMGDSFEDDELALDEEAALADAGGEDLTALSTVGGAPTPPAGANTRPAPAALPGTPAAAARTPSEETSGRIAATPRAGGTDGVSAPNLAGLAPRLAQSLTGSAPIQLNANGFTWVVVSISNRAEAEAMVARYRAAGFRSRVIEGTSGDRTMYRVAVGQFATRDDAYAVRDRLPADVRGSDDIWTMNLADA